MNYARALREVREAAGLSKRDLAERIGCDASFMTHIESGRRKPSLETLEQISNVLSVPVHLFMLRAADPEDLQGVTMPQVRRLTQLLTKLIRNDDERPSTT